MKKGAGGRISKGRTAVQWEKSEVPRIAPPTQGTKSKDINTKKRRSDRAVRGGEKKRL